jgi:tRNA threonylcarbamoyladenosine biosynthesis protein TsaE
MEFISNSEKETIEIAKKLLAKTDSSHVFCLYGDLGSGKTTFVKAFASGIGIKKNIASPTFVLAKTYPIDYKCYSLMVHIDCYRMRDGNDAESIGLLEYLQRPDVLIMIEWPEKILGLLSERPNKIHFSYLGDNSRLISVE